MKKFLSLIVGTLFLATSGAQALENTVSPKVTEYLGAQPKVGMLIGNSFSFYNCGVHDYLRGLNNQANPSIKYKMRMITISSAPLSLHDVKSYLGYHQEEPYAKEPKDGAGVPQFDVVILQAHSAAATADKRLPFFEKNAKLHADTIRASGAIPALVMTWAYKDKPESIKKLADNTIRVGNAADMLVVPVGLAFDEAKKGRPELELIMADKRHPTAAGSYLYGAVLHASIFKRNPEGNSFLGGCEKPLDKETAAYLQSVAWKTVNTFYGRQ